MNLRTLSGLLLIGLLAACSSAGPGESPTGSTSGQPTEVISPADGTPAAGPGGTTFRIDPSQSEVRFTIHEILGGNPNTVIGANSEISGEIQVDFTAPQHAQVGPIEIGAGGFETDSGLRDQSIRTFVLQSNRFPTINFVPTEIIGIPDRVSAGDTMTLQISGDLTIHGVTKTVTFDAHVTMASDQELIGSASTAILRTDFGLEIPNVPRVAGVEELVNLEIDFVAVAG